MTAAELPHSPATFPRHSLRQTCTTRSCASERWISTRRLLRFDALAFVSLNCGSGGNGLLRVVKLVMRASPDLALLASIGVSHAARLSAIGTMRRLAVLLLLAATTMCRAVRSMSLHSSRSSSAERRPANAPTARHGRKPGTCLERLPASGQFQAGEDFNVASADFELFDTLNRIVGSVARATANSKNVCNTVR